MSYLKNVTRLNAQDNPGGVLEMFVARKADVSSIPDAIGKTIAGEIAFVAGAGFVKWLATHESTTFKSATKQSREGASRSNTLEFNLPLDKESLRGMLEMAEEDEFIVVFLLPNGKQKLFGTLDSPVRFQFNHDTGREIASGSFNNCRFYFDGPDNTYWYTGTVEEQPTSTVGARVQYADGTLIALLSPTDELVLSSNFEHTFQHIPGTGSGLPAVVKWDTGTVIASLAPGDTLIVDSAFTEDLEIILP